MNGGFFSLSVVAVALQCVASLLPFHEGYVTDDSLISGSNLEADQEPTRQSICLVWSLHAHGEILGRNDVLSHSRTIAFVYRF
jgi:hypothetical protein